jgi:hypothetical protein
MIACQIASATCPLKPKAAIQGTEAAVVTFEESSDNMVATDLEATQEEMEEQQLCNGESKWTLSGHWRTDMWTDTWLCGGGDGWGSGPKEMLGPGRTGQGRNTKRASIREEEKMDAPGMHRRHKE